jgi:mannose-1-phosphate guanylyltransferase
MAKVRQAVIMVGGQGKRLRPFTYHRPKPALPVLDKPCLWYLLKSMADSGIEEVILACGSGYNSRPLTEAIGDGSDLGLKILYSHEEEPLGNGGAIKLVKDKLDDVFVAANGDVFADISLKEQIDMHFACEADLTIALTKVKDKDKHKFGIVTLDDTGRITEFIEKPVDITPSNLANAGVYVVNKKILSFTRKTVFDFSKDLMQNMVKDQKKVYGFPLKGTWMDVGRPSDLIRANLHMAAAKQHEIKIKQSGIGSSFIEKPFYLGTGAIVDRSIISSSVIMVNSKVTGCKLTKALIMENCNVDSAKIVNSIIGRGCTILPGAEIINSDVEDGTTVEAGTKIKNIRVAE